MNASRSISPPVPAGRVPDVRPSPAALAQLSFKVLPRAGRSHRQGRAVCAVRGGRLAMMQTHFGLRQRPFRATPDSGCYYPATSHERAIARLLQALQDHEGLILLSSEPGLGKTLLLHVALERLGPDVTSAFLTNS